MLQMAMQSMDSLSKVPTAPTWLYTNYTQSNFIHWTELR